MTIKDRIEEFISIEGIKRATFEKACGISNGYLRNLKSNPGEKIIENILNAYPKINRIWLLAGEGEMLKDSSTNVGEVSGDGNIVGMTVTQTIGENKGQNAGRDINNPPCPYGEKHFMAELEAQRKFAERQFEMYTDSLNKKDEQLRMAQSQIDTLIHQNQEQFNRLLALIETLKS